MSQLTFFKNEASGNYFMLDPINKTLSAISYSDRFVLSKYRHLMGFTGPDKVYNITDYPTMKKFQKALAKLDLSTVEGSVADHLVNMFPEYFI